MVVVYIEHHEGGFKKGAFEAVTYAAQIAKMLGSSCAALTIGEANGAAELGTYGADKVYNVATTAAFDSQVYATIIADAAKQLGATVVVVSHSATGKSLVGRVAVRLDAGCVTGVNHLPTFAGDTMRVKKNVFSGKAIAEFEIKSAVKVLSLMGNSVPPQATGSAVAVENLAIAVPNAAVTVISQDTVKGIVPLPEAELVVSAGRGMKGPENWGIIEELATTLGATTACSRPVADIHWRPHHEHVGQTGIAIRPNLYIAIGISGAIQHLAGVNSSKCIVVINKDPEAPFFKAADYGICGDLFEVVPQLNAALKAFKAAH
jgi:electron transfer flavoprotein alpha subunit